MKLEKKVMKGRPKKIEGGHKKTIYISDRTNDIAKKAGNGNVSDGIRIACEIFINSLMKKIL